MSLITPIAATVAAVSLLAWAYQRTSVRNARQLPPGPKPRFLIGNLLDIPMTRQWLTFDKWTKAYGDTVYVEVLGQRILVLGSIEATDELLQRRSTIYSSRPHPVMINDLMHANETQLSFMPYGERWRVRRRAFHHYFNSNVTHQWDQHQTKAARRILRRLLADPEQFSSHIRLTFGELIMEVTYGIDVSGTDDAYITDADEVVRRVGEAVPGKFLVDVIPALKYVPGWIPGAGFQQKATECREVLERVANRPYFAVKEAMARGEARDSVLSRCLALAQNEDNTAEKEIVARDMTAIAYAAGSDTTVSSLLSFFLAMAIYPKYQKKAQIELDSIVGTGRLPDISDQPNLPYVNALILEVLRWQPVLPIAIPHVNTADDEYKGWFIPKGTIIIPNTWSILQDPEAYPDPEEFRPERFLITRSSGDLEIDPDVRDPRTVAFGYGRRVCPGRHFAETSLFSVIASVLAAFTVSPCVDEHGSPVVPEVLMADGLVSHPHPFKCNIVPRSSKAAELIRESEPDKVDR